MKVMTSLLQKKQNFGYKTTLTKKKVLSLYLGFKMKTLFRYLLIIVVVFFLLRCFTCNLPTIFFHNNTYCSSAFLFRIRC